MFLIVPEKGCIIYNQLHIEQITIGDFAPGLNQLGFLDVIMIIMTSLTTPPV